MKKPNVKPVLLSGDQFAAICKIQERERQRSDIGVAPSVHQIARGWWLRRWHQWPLKGMRDGYSFDAV